MSFKEVDISGEITNFVTIYNIVGCKRDQQVYFYNHSKGIYVPLDETELRKLADEYLTNSPDLQWSNSLLNTFVQNTKTKAPYYSKMDKAGVIVLRNGTFHVADMELQPHSPDDRAIARRPFDFDTEAECPLFDSFVRQLSGGSSTIEKSIWQLCGSVAVGDSKAHKLVLLISSGGSGKSVLLNVLAELAGKEHTTKLSISEINEERAFNRVALLNSRLNVVHELGAKETFNTIFSEQIKKLITGEEVSYEFKYGERGDFVPKMSIVVASNHCPQFMGMPSESILRRLLIINIPTVVQIDKRDSDMFRKLKKELPGIFIKALGYYEDFKQSGYKFAAEQESKDFLNQCVLESYPEYVFVNENIVQKMGSREFYEDLIDAYTEWAQDKDIYVSTNKQAISKKIKNALDECHIVARPDKSNGKRFLWDIQLLR